MNVTEDADALLAFAAVVEAGSFSAAAREIGSTRQSVHRRVVRLEERLGLTLLERTTRQVRPTDLGLRVFQHALAAREAFAALADEIRSARAEPSGRLSVSVPPLMAELVLPPLFVQFSMACPDVDLVVSSELRVVDLLGESFDLAVRVGHLDSSSLFVQRLGVSAQVLVAAPGLPGLGAVRHPHDLRALPAVVLDVSDRPPRRWRLRHGGEPVDVAVRARLRCSSAALLREAAVAGLGVAALPSFYVADELANGSLVPVLPDAWDEPLPVQAVYGSRSSGNPAVAALLSTLREGLREPLGRGALPEAPGG